LTKLVIAIISQIEEEWLETLAIDYSSFHYIDFVQEAKELLPIFQEEKVDVLIPLTHTVVNNCAEPHAAAE
jgi:hypothetical protein